MDSTKSVFVGSPAMQGPTQPGAKPLPQATSGLFGSGGQTNPALVSSIGSSISSIGGTYNAIQAGKAAKDQFNLEASSKDLQAQVVKVNAAEQSNLLRKELLVNLASANASAAARGLDVGSGTPRQIQTQSIGEVERTIAKVKAGSAIEASGANVSASRTRATASTQEAAGYYKAAQGLGDYIMRSF